MLVDGARPYGAFYLRKCIGSYCRERPRLRYSANSLNASKLKPILNKFISCVSRTQRPTIWRLTQ